ncbi:bifunctional DedA family/phosphatase PAP2 family protein [Marinobacter sp. X15-166B]|uniref:bifunctional DedA family/phosphatase PAP2 family protein n=1 Tax=Marinobacter sp. X15-166B TaxID=1897620 RepID=UPI002AE056C9|nr:phosphatase PAP2 family protein [Marinobacter sp. X15-166B]
MKKGEWFFHKYGGTSVVIGRFVGPVRPVIPLIAGALLMPWKKFLSYNVVSAIAWAPLYIIPGFLVGSALGSDVTLPAHFYPALAISLAVLALLYLVAFRLQLGLGNDSRLYTRLSRWADRHPRSRHFWHSFTSARPAGPAEFPLPSFALALVCGTLFLGWSLIATSTGWLTTLNEHSLALFSGLRSAATDPAMRTITLLGDPPVLIGGALMATLVLLFRGYYAAAIHALAAAFATAALVWLLKAGFAIPRPETVFGPPDSGAYPSGHAAGITVLLSLAASFWAREKCRRQRWRIYLVFTLPMVLVCLSRVYLGVHWFTDVVGGVLLGLCICGVVRASYSRYDQIPLRAEVFTLVGLVSWVLFTAGYIYWSWTSALTAYSPL